MPKPRAPTFAQLCAIVRDELKADPTIDDAEWRERIKCTLARRRLQQPQPHVISEAMDRVEHAVGRNRGVVSAAAPSGPDPADSVMPRSAAGGLSHEESIAALSQLRERFGPLPPLKPMPAPEPELMTTRERYHTVALIEQLRTLRTQQRARAQTPRELPDAAPPGDVPRDREAGAQGLDEGLRAGVVGEDRRGRGDHAPGDRDE